MKKLRCADSQIIEILKANEVCVKVSDPCREHGMSQEIFHKWRSKFGGMDVSMMKRFKELEAKNERLKKMYSEEAYVPKGVLNVVHGGKQR